MSAAADRLAHYRAKRRFEKTPEPEGKVAASSGALAFVIQKHAATRLHYDFRLELDGVMLSWAVPKGPSFDPKDKRMAVQTEDHPLSYNSFEGTIPKGQYGAGTVIIWDRGTWEPLEDPHAALAAGKLAFKLHGHKMAGAWELVRMKSKGERQTAWLLFKKADDFARPRADYDVITALPDSVASHPLLTTDEHADPAPPEADRGERRDAASTEGALKATLPDTLKPQLATLTSEVPPGEWIFEIKFDGYRLLARIEHGKARLFTRGGHDWSDKMPVLVAELQQLGIESAWLDGEVVVLGKDGVPSFNALQNAFDRARTHDGDDGDDSDDSDDMLYFLFDAPYLEGQDLRKVPLRERRRLVQALLERNPAEHLHFSEHFDGDLQGILQSACRMKLEGVIAKRADAPYVSRRTTTWLKVKCQQRQEFVIGGWTDRGDVASAPEVGSLLLGVHDDAGRLVPVGSVGTGWSAQTAADLKAKLLKLQTKASPFAGELKKGRWSRRAAGSEHWVKPQLVAEVSFAEWTPEGQLRHASFEGLRADKPAKAISREQPVAVADHGRRAAAGDVSIKVSHPERVIDPSTGHTKLDLVRYYESVADWMVPHLEGRPCSLVRGPSGIGGALFFQKHAEKLRIPQARDLDPALWPDHEALLEIPTAKAIAGAAQMNVIEFHTWNALAKRIDRPDRMIFDLDPGEGVSWQRVQEAAGLMRALLEELKLQAWLKTSGGKGLHVVVPIAPRHGWTAVKGFSQAVVQHLARVIPDRFVAKSGAANRKGRIFVDYIRNGHGATTAAAFSARARPGLGVSMPVPWDDLPKLKGGAHWTIATAREHLSFQTIDPWAAYWSHKQSITAAMKALGYAPSQGGEA